MVKRVVHPLVDAVTGTLRTLMVTLIPMFPCVCLAGNAGSSPIHSDANVEADLAQQAAMPVRNSHAVDADKAEVSIAFLPDIHFHDIYADLGPHGFPGTPAVHGGRPMIVRTMQAQTSSTRLINESYFALRAALDDIVAKNIYIVILNCDLVDDGQPVHMEALKEILLHYQQRHGLTFFVTVGNHDINRPFSQPGGKRDYLGRDPASGRVGYAQAIASPGYRFAPEITNENTVSSDTQPPGQPRWQPSVSPDRNAVYWTPVVREMGYTEFTRMMAPFGVMPHPSYLYYETPYSDYTPESYTFEKAWAQGVLSHRQYQICQHGNAAITDATNVTNTSAAQPNSPSFCKAVPDVSYLVEPVRDVWLLMIDANVFVPSGDGENDFTPAGDAGFNRMVTHKAHVIAWMKRVAQRAATSGKRLVTSSHYPALDWMPTRADTMARLFGNELTEMARRPSENTARQIADTGVRLHIGGHLHKNATTVRLVKAGTPPLVNVQVSALGGYAPAYKIVTLKGLNEAIVDTVPIVAVNGFKTLFPLYKQEHAYLSALRNPSLSPAPIWPLSLLEASDYKDFTRRHLEAVIVARHIKTWPPLMQTFANSQLSGVDLLTLAAMRQGPTVAELSELPDSFLALRTLLHAQNDALAVAQSWVLVNGMQLEDFGQWSVRDVINDLMGLHQAGGLAMDDIPPRRLEQYAVLTHLLDTAPSISQGAGPLSASSTASSLSPSARPIGADVETDAAIAQKPFSELFQAYFHPLMHVLQDLTGAPLAKRIAIDLDTGAIRELGQ